MRVLSLGVSESRSLGRVQGVWVVFLNPRYFDGTLTVHKPGKWQWGPFFQNNFFAGFGVRAARSRKGKRTNVRSAGVRVRGAERAGEAIGIESGFSSEIVTF